MQYSGYYAQVRRGRDLPADYGDWKNTHRRFCRWRDKGLWENLLAQVIDVPDFEWIMIDGFHIKAHPHAAGAGNQDMSRTKGAQCGSPNKLDTFLQIKRDTKPHLIYQV